MPWPEDAFDAQIDADVKKFGQGVIGTETEERVPMAYTVGLAEADLPEIVCFGLDQKDIGLLNDVAALLRTGELPLDTPFAKITKKRLFLKWFRLLQALGMSIMRTLARATR
jgi:hypothetical protein